MAGYHKREVKRKNGTTYIRWEGTTFEGGKRKVFYGRSEREVKAKIKEYENDLFNHGTILEKTKILLQDYVKDYILKSLNQRVSSSTVERYMSLYYSHIENSPLGKKYIHEIKLQDIEKFFKEKTKLSKSSMSLLSLLLKQTFRYAISNNIIRINPCTDFVLPKSEKEKKEIKILTLAEQDRFLKSAQESRYFLLYFFTLCTGLRAGEVMALRWENIDLKNKVLKVRESARLVRIYDDKGNASDVVEIKEPKTKESIRDIPLGEQLVMFLEEHKNISTSNYVFTNMKNEMLTHDTLDKSLKVICNKAKIGEPIQRRRHNKDVLEYTGITFHCLRHTFATRLIENGIDVKTVSQLLGHSKTEITINRYVHSTDDSKKAAIESLSNITNIRI
nr:site-specific integrase [uncultured Cellulosilyticum sp.]